METARNVSVIIALIGGAWGVFDLVIRPISEMRDEIAALQKHQAVLTQRVDTHGFLISKLDYGPR